MGRTFAAPGADTRQWVSYGTVHEEVGGNKSVTFEDGQQYVRVRLHPSELVVNARVLGKVAGAGEGESHPFVEHDEVLVILPEGNERAGAVCIGKLNNSLDALPGLVAGNDPSTNAFTWKRIRTPRAVETYGGDIVSDAKSGTIYGIGIDGAFSVQTTDGGFLTVGPDDLGMQTVEGDMYFQADIQKGTWLLGTHAGTTPAFLLLGEANQGIYTKGKFYLAAGGVQPDQHLALWEGLLAYMEAYIRTYIANCSVLVAGSPVPVLANSLPVVVPADPGPTMPAHIQALNAAYLQMTGGGKSPYSRGVLSG